MARKKNTTVSWKFVRSQATNLQGLLASERRKNNAIVALENEKHRLQDLTQQINHLHNLLQAEQDDHWRNIYQGQLDDLVPQRNALQLKLQRKIELHNIVVVRELNRLRAETSIARQALRAGLYGLKRTKVARVQSMVDVFALEMFRLWGGEPIRFRISGASPFGHVIQVLNAMRPLFDAENLMMKTDTTYTMNRAGAIALGN